jgi:hypothetical protein
MVENRCDRPSGTTRSQFTARGIRVPSVRRHVVRNSLSYVQTFERRSMAALVELANDCLPRGPSVAQVEPPSGCERRIGVHGIDLRKNLGRWLLSARSLHSPLVLGADGLAHDTRHLNSGLAELGRTSGILGAEAQIQQGHVANVNTNCLYVKDVFPRTNLPAARRDATSGAHRAPVGLQDLEFLQRNAVSASAASDSAVIARPVVSAGPRP